jgi:hypothetical protein
MKTAEEKNNEKLKILSEMTGYDIKYLEDAGEYRGVLTVNDCLEAMEEYAEYCHKQKMEERTCKWNYDEEECFYNTECDEAYCLIDGDLQDNKHNYCPFCGKKIKLISKEEGQ